MSSHQQESHQNERRPSFFQSLPKLQRNSFIFLSVLSLAVLILWIWQLNFRLSSPFRVPSEANVVLDEEAAAFEKLLLNNDTDGDGLTDYEENSLYNTSAYLADTDGDGLSDRVEIEQGSDPLCAPGQACNNSDAIVINDDPVVSNLNAEEEIVAINDNMLQDMMTGQANAQQLRVLLLESGADAQMLEQLSDDDLLAAYKEMLNQEAQ